MNELKSPDKPFEISKWAVQEAWEKVKANKGAPGVDGVSIEGFEADLQNNLYKVWNRMSSGSYFPPPVRAVEIPKPHGGGTRLLGVPTIADRVAQTVVAEELATCLAAEAGGRDWNPFIHMPVGFTKLTGPKVNWEFETVPQAQLNNRPMWYPQGRTIGGSTSINAMIYIRGHREDYEAWAAAGNKEWGYDQVLPFFRKAEHNERLNDEFHGSDGPMNVTEQVQHNDLSKAFVRAAQELGAALTPDFNGAKPGRCRLLRRHPESGASRSRLHRIPASGPQAIQPDHPTACTRESVSTPIARRLPKSWSRQCSASREPSPMSVRYRCI